VNALTQGIYDYLSSDLPLVGMLASYDGAPAIFTIDPVPGDAVLPYLVSAGDVTDTPFDTKLDRGRRIWRDVRCYAAADGDSMPVEQIAERVRALLHRHKLIVAGYGTLVAECSGPRAANEQDVYGRIVTVKLIMMES
jgi:hypothetical protein